MSSVNNKMKMIVILNNNRILLKQKNSITTFVNNFEP